MIPAKALARKRLDSEAARTALHFALHLAGFAGSTIVMAWGVLALFFVAIGGFSLDGMMHQLANLSNRYVAAAPARLSAFRQDFAAIHLVIIGILVLLRCHRILPASKSKDNSHG